MIRDFECPTGWSDCDSCQHLKGQEEDGTVICSRRPKQFGCPQCGSKQFVLVRNSGTLVDFSREGAVEGHPFLKNVGEESCLFKCDRCGTTVPDEQAQEMLKEVI